MAHAREKVLAGGTEIIPSLCRLLIIASLDIINMPQNGGDSVIVGFINQVCEMSGIDHPDVTGIVSDVLFKISLTDSLEILESSSVAPTLVDNLNKNGIDVAQRLHTCRIISRIVCSDVLAKQIIESGGIQSICSSMFSTHEPLEISLVFEIFWKLLESPFKAQVAEILRLNVSFNLI